jgi:DNA polymerase gamma 1
MKKMSRLNKASIQLIPTNLHNSLFPNSPDPLPQSVVDLSLQHLKKFNLLGKTIQEKEIDFRLPNVQKSLANHLYLIGLDQGNSYQEMVAKLKNVPEIPTEFSKNPGWTKYYNDGTSESVDVKT